MAQIARVQLGCIWTRILADAAAPVDTAEAFKLNDLLSFEIQWVGVEIEENERGLISNQAPSATRPPLRLV
jgi:hypothetical protein